jgi:glutathione S-transferase
MESELNNQSKLKLVYFNAKGLAETSRILLALASVEFEDFRYPLDIIDPVAHIYKRDEFDFDKQSGKFDISMGKLPVLEIFNNFDTKFIPQSKAIERYLANQYGFMGSTSLETAHIDSICETVRDIKEKYYKNKTDAEKEEYAKGLENELVQFSKTLDTANEKFAVGNKMSLADISIYHLVTQFARDNLFLEAAAKIPRLRKIVVEVAKQQGLIEWLAKRPKTAF